MSDFLGDVLFEVRRHWRSRVAVVVVALGVLAVVAGGAVLVTWVQSNRAQPPQLDSSSIPLGAQTASYVQVLDCIYRGAEECENYSLSKDWIISTSSTLTYVPVEGDAAAPGEDDGSGRWVVGNLPGLSDEAWRSLAAGMTLEGRANPGTVTEKSVSTGGFEVEQLSAWAEFTLPADEVSPDPVTGTMSFTVSGSGKVAMTGVSYEAGA